jgi:large repetitive protein
VFVGNLIAGRVNPVQVTASVAGRLNCFYDFDGNGVFTGAGEYVFNELAISAGLNNLNLTVPQSAANTQVYWRCRFSDIAGDGNSPTGPATRGEVEDGRVQVLAADLGDLPDAAAGSASGDYRTRLADNGATHGLISTLRMGACVDAEADGQPDGGAAGDDSGAGLTLGTCAIGNDDEDGVTVADLAFVATQAADVRVAVTNGTGADARLCGFVDWNGDGDFDDTVAGTAESALSQVVATGASNLTVTLAFGTAPVTTTTSTYARFRLQAATLPCNAQGAALTGEVEDYAVTVTPPDFGDLPDTGAGVGAGNYETLLANGGPYHPLRAGLQLGACVDSEANGNPAASADGDDLSGGLSLQGSCANANDDEDGLSAAALQVLGNLVAGGSNSVAVLSTNTTGVPARLCGFVDFNGDGDFADAGETQSAAVASGSNNIPISLAFTPPLTAQPGTRYARFRLSTDLAGNCNANGGASDGEVEDYVAAVRFADFGDLPDTGAGTGTGNYVTLRSDGQVAHDLTSTATTLFLGAGVDAEGDGQPSVDADGDDLSGVPDDEDGLNPADLIQIQNLPAIFRFTATNQTGAMANLCGYVDWNSDGDFDDAGEAASSTLASGASGAPISLNFGTVPAFTKGDRYARFRFSNSNCAAMPATGDIPGSFPNGEVEDYVLRDLAADRGDLPDTGPGTGAGNYQTLLGDGGPSHGMVPGLRLGACVDSENDGQPGTAADGDDLGAGNSTLGSCAVANDDEDGISVSDLDFISTLPARVGAVATNTTGTAATLCGFVDWNGDGDFADTVGGVAETAQVVIPDGSTNLAVTVDFGNAPVAPVGSSYARFRIGTAPGCDPNGIAIDGEVEDYPVTITRRDFGDLPDGAVGTAAGNYQTLLNDNGAAHDIVDGLFLGALVDPEGDGQPNAAANGDDNAGVPDDEDGVDLSDLANFHLGSPANLHITATNVSGVAAQACAFVDWNQDGDFADTREAASVPVPNGSNGASFTLSFGPVPSFGPLGQTYARVRLQNADTACTPNGLVDAGEVEDYTASVLPGEMSLGNLVWQDHDNSGTVNNAELPFAGIAVDLFRDANDDGTPDGAAIATQFTDASGHYLFDELVPDTYLVCITAPIDWITSSGSGRRYATPGPNEPAADPDNDVNDNDDGSAGAPATRICARGLTLEFQNEPISDGDADNNSNLSVDFGLVYNFDLALRKTLSPGQSVIVRYDDVVSFNIEVFNQGTVGAQNIVITDTIPAGMQLVDANWTAGAGNTATRVLAGPLAPGTSQQSSISLRVLNSALPGELRNLAEISAAQDSAGQPVPSILDIDSDPDGNAGNDPEVDDEIGNAGGDEDDADPAIVILPAPPIPMLDGRALALLTLLLLAFGLRRVR